MAPQTWTSAPWSATADEPFAVFVTALQDLDPAPDGPLRSASGRAAVVVRLDALRATDDIEIHLDASGRGRETVALLLTDADTSLLIEELLDLSAAADLVAVPQRLATGSPRGFSPRGQITQRVDPALFDTFEVWEPATAAELLTRDAPVGLGEEPDNLTGRADWFKKRHAREPESR